MATLKQLGNVIAWTKQPAWTGGVPSRPYIVSTGAGFCVRDDAANVTLDQQTIATFSADAPEGQALDSATLELTLLGAQRIGSAAPSLIVEAVEIGPGIDGTDHSRASAGVKVGEIPWPTQTAKGAKITVPLTGLAAVDQSSGDVSLRVRARSATPGVWAIVPSTVALTDAGYVSTAAPADPRMERAIAIASLLGVSVERVLLAMDLGLF